MWVDMMTLLYLRSISFNKRNYTFIVEFIREKFHENGMFSRDFMNDRRIKKELRLRLFHFACVGLFLTLKTLCGMFSYEYFWRCEKKNVHNMHWTWQCSSFHGPLCLQTLSRCRLNKKFMFSWFFFSFVCVHLAGGAWTLYKLYKQRK